MGPSLTVGRVAGIRIGVHWSWLVILTLIVWTLASGVFPDQNPGLSDATYGAMAVVAAVLFFGGLLLHELGHALQARREGMEIQGITLWLFGGVASFTGAFPSARAELRVAVAGPVVTAVVSGCCALLAWAGLPTAVDGVAAWLAIINAVLLAFNLLPALPLDGGRVLHAALWAAKGDVRRATAVAAGVGRGFGLLLIGSGIALFVGGQGGGGIWLAFLGWFLLQAATGEARHLMLRDALGHLRVGDLMVRDPVTVSPGETLASFMDEVAHTHRYTTYPVTGNGHPLGLLAFARVAATPRDSWDDRHVEDVMLRIDELPVVDASMPLLDAVAKMQERGLDRTLVVEQDELAGLLSITDVGRVISEAAAAPAGTRPS
jgi:Zn-dependent protease